MAETEEGDEPAAEQVLVTVENLCESASYNNTVMHSISCLD